MGAGRWDHDSWSDYAKEKDIDNKTTDEIFDNDSLVKELNPHGVVLRESCDSPDNPNSTAIILALDVTGSMGIIADTMARKGLPVLLTEIYDRKPVPDPHVMCMGIGDCNYGMGRDKTRGGWGGRNHDTAPLQVTQFEADIRISEQLEKLFLEHGGGGNNHESYALAWYFAAKHTKIDCFEKRGKKGYLFTIGDEEPTPILFADDIKRVCGDTPEIDIEMKDLLTEVSRKYEVFHILVEQGSHASDDLKGVTAKWREVLGQRVISLSDYTKLAEVIVSTIQVREGAEASKVAASWDGDTSLVVSKAVGSLTARDKDASSAVVSI